MYYVYVLKDADQKVYVGYSSDLKKRFGYHARGEVKTTSAYAAPELIWYCAFKEKGRALEFEKYLKVGSGHAFARKHLIP